MRRMLLAPLVLLAGSTSCVIVDPSCSSTSASVVVTPTVVVVAVGESFTPHASSWCGGHQTQAYPRWSLSNAGDSAFVNLDQMTGQITGRRIGRATVIAGTEEASVSVTVR